MNYKTKSKFNYQNLNLNAKELWCLGFGFWSLFGIWHLEFLL
jgi:hypothetical protein